MLSIHPPWLDDSILFPSFRSPLAGALAATTVLIASLGLGRAGAADDEAKADPSTVASAKVERPNVVLVMVDDMGFSDLGYHGGEIDTPNLGALARGGVRFSQFHNSGRCCPTRATLLTGLHPHQTGIGWMTQPPGSDRGAGKPPAYQGYLNRQCATIAEILRDGGYATLMAGKWHLGGNARDRWPRQRGFDEFYGSLSGATRFFHPHGDRGITLGNEPVPEPESTTDEAFYTTDAFTDYGIRFLREHRESDRKDDPFFLYLAYTAPHWPLQAFEDDIAKYRGEYSGGWDELRKKRYERQVELGLIDEEWDLSPRTPGIPDWESLSEEKRDEMDLKMAVYAAMIDRVDQNVGRLVDFLEESGVYEDTLILFLADNGACQEGGMLGRGPFRDVEKRNLSDNNSYGEAWANAGNTPFRLYKHFAHEGGTATPFFMHWPERIEPREDWYDEPAQVIDIVPTILDVAGAEYPEQAHGNAIPPPDGLSLRPAFDGKPLGRDEPIFLEHETNAAVREGKWKLVGTRVATNDGTDAKQWELYDMDEDRTETRDLAAERPQKVEELAAKWEQWAERVQVYPRGGVGVKTPKPGAYSANRKKPKGKKQANRKKQKEDALQPEATAPQIGGRAFSVVAMARHSKPKGVVLAQGGNRFGWSLHFVDGRPAFSVRNEGQITEIVAEEPVSGRTELVAELTVEYMRLLVGGRVVAETQSPGLLAEQPKAGFFVGFDGAQPVGDYRAPNRFNGRVFRHLVKRKGEKVAMRTEWGENVTAENAWREYPRPQMRRDDWTNLNGHWDYAVTSGEREEPPADWDGEILVPYAIEAPLSGVERRITTDDALWYRRSFAAPNREGKRTLLHFEAVDYHGTVWVNGEKVGEHKGGNLPFSFDITDALHDGDGNSAEENELLVRVTDATDHPDAYQLHGKQLRHNFGIYYTPVSGIWQTVWMEEVPFNHTSALNIEASNTGSVTVWFDSNVTLFGQMLVRGSVSLDGEKIASARGNPHKIEFEITDPKFWSPDSPTLYDLEIEFGKDKLESYFAFRETGIAQDADGHPRFTLNGEEIFHWGTLDQGWWPDGLLTPPSDEAMLSDIDYLEAAGFNTIRKHVKVEPRRYYWHCDRLGILIWQDQVNAGTGTRRGEGLASPKWSRLEPGPTDAEWPDEAHAQYMAELKRMIDTLGNHPSIVQWVPFNEAWGQHRTAKVSEWTAQYDPTRAINAASGGNWFPVGDIVDAHAYPHPEFPFDQDRGRWDDYVKVMGEFGGHGFPVEGHLWDPDSRNWGYGGLPEDRSEWLERYRTSLEMLAELRQKGIAGGIYTQTTDVEGEINGLRTYDRRVEKVAPETLRAMAQEVLGMGSESGKSQRE